MVQSFTLMILGMGTVFLFLAILVGSVKLLSSLISENKIELPAAQNLPENLPSSPGEKVTQQQILDDPELISAITTAVHQYRAQQRQNK